MTTFTKNTSGVIQEEKKFDICEKNTIMNCEKRLEIANEVINLYNRLQKQITELEEEKKECLEKCLWAGNHMKEILEFTEKIKKENDELKEELKAIQEEKKFDICEKNTNMNCEMKNKYEICKMILTDKIEKDIMMSLENGEDSVWVELPKPNNFYRKHYINFINDVFIPHLTTYECNQGGHKGLAYRDGYYYLNGDWLFPYKLTFNVEPNGHGHIELECLGCVENDEFCYPEDEEDSSSEEEIEDVEFDDEGTPYVKHIENNNEIPEEFRGESGQKKLKEKIKQNDYYDCYMMDCENEAFRNFIAPGQQKRLYDFGMKKRYDCKEWMTHLINYMDTDKNKDSVVKRDVYIYTEWVKQGGGDFWTES